MDENESPHGGSTRKDKGLSKFKRGFFVIVGTVFLGLGVLGIALPVLPTTPFLLLSAACYYKGSKRMHNWLLNNKWFGGYIRNYMEGRGIPLRTKAFAMALLWLLFGYWALFILNTS